MERKKKIIVLRGGALGDFILTLPAIDSLRKAFPDAELVVMAYSQAAFLLPECGVADRVFSLHNAQAAALFSEHPGNLDWLAGIFSGADLIVNYLNDPDGIVNSNILPLCNAQIISHQPLVKGCHAAEYFKLAVKQFEPAHKTEEPRGFTLRLSKKIKDAGKQAFIENNIEGKAIAIHPGSGSIKKNWSPEKFTKLANILHDKHSLTPFFITGEADTVVSDKLEELDHGYPVLHNLPLDQVCGILHSASGYAGNDSGITHLSAVIGTPVTAVFGPTDPAVWGPPGANVEIIKAGKLNEISPEQVACSLQPRTLSAL